MRPHAMTYMQQGAMSAFDPRYALPGSWGLGRVGVPKALRHADRAARANARCAVKRRLANVVVFLEKHCDMLGCAAMVRERARHFMHLMARAGGGMKRVKKDELLSIVSVCIAAREHRLVRHPRRSLDCGRAPDTTARAQTYTFRELADVCENVSKKDICKCYKVYQRAPAMRCTRAPPLLVDVIPRYCAKLKMAFAVEKDVRECIRRLNADRNMRTMNPLTKIATALNVASAGRELEKIGAVCGVSVHTITKSTARYKGSQ